MAGLTIFVFAALFGCALAAPTPAPEPCLHPGGYTPYNIQAFFYSMQMYQSYQFSYYESHMCMEYNINVPSGIPTIWYDDFDRMALEAKCRSIEFYNNLYPPNLSPQLWDMTIDQVSFDYVVIGISPGTMYIAMYLTELGYDVALVDSGMLAPPLSRSPYFSLSLLGSPYMDSIPAHVPGLSKPKKFYTSKMTGGMQMIESNQWLHGGQSFYQQMSQISSYFDYSKVMSRFSSFEYSQTTTQSTTSVSSNGYSMSYYTYSQSTTITTSIQSWYSDLGYGNFSPFDDSYGPGLYSMPTIGNNGMYSLYLDEIFGRFSSFNGLYMFLNVQINRVIYEMGIIVAIELITPYGMKIIYVQYDVFFGSSTIEMFKILTRSGIGNPLHMNRFGIPPLVELPALGRGVRTTPTYANPFAMFPKFSLAPAEINDYSALSFMFNSQSYMSSFDSLYNYRAFMSFGGSPHSNVMYSFYAFNSLMINRLEYVLGYQFQFTYEQIQYIRTCLETSDILFITATLIDSSSIGYLEFGETIEDVILQSQMYSSQTDITIMIEAIMYLEQIFQTSSFLSSQAQIKFVSSMSSSYSMNDFFNTHTIQESLLKYSHFNFQSSGGLNMGNSMTNSVVNSNLSFYNVANLFALNSGISPFSVPYNNLAFNTLLGNMVYDTVQERISSGFYEQMRSAEFYNNMINSNIGGMSTRSMNTMGMNTMGINGIDTMGGMNTVGMNTMGLNNMGGLNMVEESMYESEMESISSGGLLNTGGIGGVGGIGGMGSGIGGSSIRGSGIDINGGGIDINGGGIGINGGGIGNGIGGLGGYGSGMSTSSFSETEIESMSMGSSSIGGGFGSVQESSYMSTESESATVIGGGGGGFYGGGSSSMISEYEAESSSRMQASSGGFGGGSYYSEQEMEMESYSESSNVMVC